MRTYRLRIELPDRPGALARVAALIAGSGGDVVAVDIHELDGGVAVDEVVVVAPDGWEPARLTDALERSGAGMVLSSQVVTDDARDRRDTVAAALRSCVEMVAAGVAGCDDVLGRAVLDVTRASVAWTCTVPGALDLPAGGVALERGGPVVVRTDGLPPQYGNGLPRWVWLLAAPDSALNPGLVVFAARPLALRFTATDIARVEALLHLRLCVVATDRRAAVVG